jgi:hypothetical protein
MKWQSSRGCWGAPPLDPPSPRSSPGHWLTPPTWRWSMRSGDPTWRPSHWSAAPTWRSWLPGVSRYECSEDVEMEAPDRIDVDWNYGNRIAQNCGIRWTLPDPSTNPIDGTRWVMWPRPNESDTNLLAAG